ncbi:MAG TPA: WD40 repeat domain-containing protein [Thermoguttaceae bacterium]|nr:WD40 repeat domain-containing protein [Thermoguttaceae bacterium]
MASRPLIAWAVLCAMATTAAAKPRPALDRYGDPLPAGAVARLGQVRVCDYSYIEGAKFSADGKRLICFRGYGRVGIWDARGGQLIHEFNLGDSNPEKRAVSADGSTTAWFCGDYVVRTWDLTHGKMLGQREFRRHLDQLALSSDGKLLLTVSAEKTFCLWDAATFEKKHEILDRDYVRAKLLTLSADGKLFAVAGEDKHIGVWQLDTGKRTFRFGPLATKPTALLFSPGGKTLIAGLEDSTVHRFDLGTGEAAKPLVGEQGETTPDHVDIGHSQQPMMETVYRAPIRALAYSPDGHTLWVGHPTIARAWDPAAGKVLKSVSLSPQREMSTAGLKYLLFEERLMGNRDLAAFSPDCRTVVTGGRPYLHFWDLTGGVELRTGEGHGSPIFAMAVGPAGKLLATGSDGGVIRLWQLPGGEPLGVLGTHDDKVRSLAFCQGGKALVSGGLDRRLRFWDVATRKPLREQPADAYPWFMAASRDGHTLAVTGSESIALYDAVTGKRTGAAAGRFGRPRFSSDGKLLAIGTRQQLCLWDVIDGKMQTSVDLPEEPIFSGAFSSDLRLAVVARSAGPVVWDLNAGKAVLSLEKHDAYITAAAFSPDDRLLATASYDGHVRLWEMPSGKRLATFTGHTASVNALAWLPDGKTLASGSADASILLWDAGRHVAAPAPER